MVFSPIGVSVCLLSQTICWWLSFCAFKNKSHFDSNFFEKFHPSPFAQVNKKQETRNKLQQMCRWRGGEEFGGQKSGWEVQKIKQKSLWRVWGSTLHLNSSEEFKWLEIEKVCLILDTKNKNHGFILAPRGPCHARMTLTLHNSIAKVNSQETSKKE